MDDIFYCNQCGEKIEKGCEICVSADGDFVCSWECKDDWEEDHLLSYFDE